MSIKKSRSFGRGGYTLHVTTFVRRGEVILTSCAATETPEGIAYEVTARLTVPVSPEAMKILRRGSDEEAMTAVFRRLGWFTHPRIREAITEIVSYDFPALRDEHKARMEASRRRRLEAIAPPRDGLEHFVAVVISRLPPRAIKVGGVA
jgi:hypothetical protein